MFYRRLVVVILATLIAAVRGAANGYGIACVSGTDTCSVSGTACIDDGTSTSTKKCQCNGDYVANAAVDACVKKFGKTCSADADCLSYGTCSKTCACSIGYVASKDSTKCLGNFGSACMVVSDCLANGACTSSVCACATNHHASANKTVCYKDIGQACTAATDCDSAKGAICDLHAASATCKLEFGMTCSSTAECLSYGTCSTTCACSIGYVASKDSTKCLGNFGSACMVVGDCLANGACTSSVCACATNHHASANKTVCYKDIEQACTAATDCDSAKGALCDLNAESATCKLGYDAICRGNTDKCVTHAECSTSTSKCVCQTNYSPNGNLCGSGATIILASILLIAVSQLWVFL